MLAPYLGGPMSLTEVRILYELAHQGHCTATDLARGLGLGAVSEAEFIADPRFVPVRIAGEPASTATYVYCMAERADSELIRSFLNAI